MDWVQETALAMARIREAYGTGGLAGAKAAAQQIQREWTALQAGPTLLALVAGWILVPPLATAALGAGVSAAGTVIGAGVSYYAGLDEQVAATRRLTGNYTAMDLAVDKAGKSTSAFVGNIIDVQKETALLGSTTGKVTAGINELYTSSRVVGLLFTDNTGRAQEQVRAYSKLAIQLDALGISNKAYAATVDVVGKTYRMTDIVGATEELGVHFVNLQRATGISAETIATDFGMAVKDLAAYSYPEMLRVFSGLEAQVAATGVSMNTLLSITKKFDTFESAATAVGDLNAMLGGPYLNTLDMINATEEERIALLQDMMAQGGRTWESMARFEKKAIAEALGTSVQEASRLMQGSRDEMDDITASAEDNALSLEKLLGVTEKGLYTAAQGAAHNAVALKAQLEGLTQASLGILDVYEQIRVAQQGIFRPWAANIETIKTHMADAFRTTAAMAGRIAGPMWAMLRDYIYKSTDGEIDLDVIITKGIPPAAPATPSPPQALGTRVSPATSNAHTGTTGTQTITFQIGEEKFKTMVVKIVDGHLQEKINVFA